MVTTKDGRMYDGVISNETPGMITLRGGSDEGDETILRANIAQMRASSLSLMPDGLEKALGAPGTGGCDRLSARRPVADGKPVNVRHHPHGAPRRLPAAAIFRARNARACRCRRLRNPPRRRMRAASPSRGCRYAVRAARPGARGKPGCGRAAPAGSREMRPLRSPACDRRGPRRAWSAAGSCRMGRLKQLHGGVSKPFLHVQLCNRKQGT